MRCYVLFAGSQRTPHGGLADLVGIFTSEATARQAFRNLRLSQTSATSWAQLAVMDGDHGIRALSWFGIGATPARTPVTFPRPDESIYTQTEGGVMQVATRETPSPAGPEVEPTARRRPVKRIAVWLVGLVAVGAISIGVASNDRSTRPVIPKPATADAGGRANDPVVPFSVDTSVVADGISSFDR
jgi:hypothetical protein